MTKENFDIFFVLFKTPLGSGSQDLAHKNAELKSMNRNIGMLFGPDKNPKKRLDCGVHNKLIHCKYIGLRRMEAFK